MYRNSYKGVGLSFGINTTASKTSGRTTKQNSRKVTKKDKDGKKTKVSKKTKEYSSQNKDGKLSGGLGLGFDSQNGADWQGSISFGDEIKQKNGQKGSWGVGLGIGHNSLSGLKSLSLNGSLKYKTKTASNKFATNGFYNGICCSHRLEYLCS